MSNNALTSARQSLRLYGRRKGKRLRPSRQALLDRALSSIRIDIDKEGVPITPKALFTDMVDAMWLEIGYGGGEHLAAQANTHQNVGFIGAEVFENGIASLLRHCEEKQLTNVRIFDDDVRALLPALAKGSLARVFLLYPDPWPKSKHAKRRFICPETLTALAQVMSPGAELRIATDHPAYARWCLQHGPVHPCFEWLVTGSADWRTGPAGAVATRYEEKAIRAGRKPSYFTFAKTVF